MNEPETDLITKNDIKVKVFYSFRGSTTLCLCSYKTSLTHGKFQTIVDIPLRPCLQILCTSSPDILLESDKDCAVYSAHFHSMANSGEGKDFVWEGHGLLSWILEEQFCSNHLINGKLCQHHIEVQLELHQTRRMSKSDYYHELTKSAMDPSQHVQHYTSHSHTPSASLPFYSTVSGSIAGTTLLVDQEKKGDTQLAPILFHANASSTATIITTNSNLTKLPDSPRKRIRLMSEDTCRSPDPISANDNNTNHHHWSKSPPRATASSSSSTLYTQPHHSISLPPPSHLLDLRQPSLPQPDNSLVQQQQQQQSSSSLSPVTTTPSINALAPPPPSLSQPASLSSSSPSSLSSPPSTTTSFSSSSAIVPAPLTPYSTPSGTLSIFTTTNGRRKKRDTKPPNASDVRTFTKVHQDKNGNYCLPVEIDSWTVYSLGYVVYDRPAFHNQRYIYPVGYKVKKWYRSMIDPKSDTQYVCEILDGGQEPIFRLEADDNPGKSYTGPTPTTVWTIAVREAFAIRNMDYGHNPVGPDFFGLRKNAIAKMIQDLPNADKCNNYIWQKFMEGTPSKPSKGRTSK